jgi:hypothetical protein
VSGRKEIAAPTVPDLASAFIQDLWNSAPSDFPRLERRYTKCEQREREQSIENWIDRVDSEIRVACRKMAGARETIARVTELAVEMSVNVLDLADSGIEPLLGDGFSQIGSDLALRARELDPRVSLADILQACRNAWVACGLQLLFGHPARLTPGIFGYSMLYPYSDNYLDDPSISRQAKLRFSERFRRRLCGDLLDTTDAHEQIVYTLVGLIESQYSRERFPQVYDSLLAIHAAQQDSLRQTQKGQSLTGSDLLLLTATKGGSSVLADAYLAAGALSEEEARFAFNWGVLLQLSDDLQDLLRDRKNGSFTLFSLTAKHEPLDALTNRIFHLADAVLCGVSALAGGSDVLQKLLIRSSRMLLIRSAASVPALYTRAYRSELEAYSPFTFDFLTRREKRVARRRRSYVKLFDLYVAEQFQRPDFSPGMPCSRIFS